MTASITPDVTIEGSGSTSTVPDPPTITQLGQYGAIIVARVIGPVFYPNPIVAMTLFRSRDAGVTDPWKNVCSEQVDPYSTTTDLIDPNPIFGENLFYAATANDVNDNVSALSPALQYGALRGQTT